MKFTWKDMDNIGIHRLELFNDEERCVADMSVYDYTCEYSQKADKENRTPRSSAFVAITPTMDKKFGYDKFYMDRVDENGFYLGGYHGKCDTTLDEVKRWCEEYIASHYIINYEAELEKLNKRKEISDWFIANGYTGKVD